MLNALAQLLGIVQYQPAALGSWHPGLGQTDNSLQTAPVCLLPTPELKQANSNVTNYTDRMINTVM